MTSIESDPASQRASTSRVQSDDRLLWGYLLFAVCCDIILVTLIYVDSSLVLALYVFVLVVLVMIVGSLMGMVALFRQKFRRAAALLLAPVIVASPFLFPIGRLEYEALDLIRFYLNKNRYDAVIGALSPAERASKVVFFNWGVTGILDAASYVWLVYDESGEIALSDEDRSQAWKERVYPEHRLVDRHCLTSTHHLSGHYYTVVMHCAGA